MRRLFLADDSATMIVPVTSLNKGEGRRYSAPL